MAQNPYQSAPGMSSSAMDPAKDPMASPEMQRRMAALGLDPSKVTPYLLNALTAMTGKAPASMTPMEAGQTPSPRQRIAGQRVAEQWGKMGGYPMGKDARYRQAFAGSEYANPMTTDTAPLRKLNQAVDVGGGSVASPDQSGLYQRILASMVGR